MTVNKKSLVNLKKGEIVSRKFLYAKISQLAPTAIDKLEELMNSTVPAVKLGAINKVLDKSLPDAENPKDNTPLQVNVFIPILKENRPAL